MQGRKIAEHVMGGLLVLSRRFDRTLAAQREQRLDGAHVCAAGRFVVRVFVGVGGEHDDAARAANRDRCLVGFELPREFLVQLGSAGIGRKPRP